MIRWKPERVEILADGNDGREVGIAGIYVGRKAGFYDVSKDTYWMRGVLMKLSRENRFDWVGYVCPRIDRIRGSKERHGWFFRSRGISGSR